MSKPPAVLQVREKQIRQQCAMCKPHAKDRNECRMRPDTAGEHSHHEIVDKCCILRNKRV